MALDVHICGAGFGEMILLRWDEENSSHAALVDGYSGNPDVTPILQWFRNEGAYNFEFIVATHPHLDHVRNLDEILHCLSGQVERLWRWPGLDHEMYTRYFNKLAKKFPDSKNDLGTRALAVSGLFDECATQRYDLELGKPVLEPVPRLKRIYPTSGPSGDFEVICISPWDDSLFRFVKLVSDGIRPKGELIDTHRDANLVSSGFLLRYKKSQVLLGGDMEERNWQELVASRGCPSFNPCLVKVSHHGSSTGCLDGMWGADGFLGRHKPIAVITPWHGDLPEQDVLNEISGSGCETYLTGQQRSSRVRDCLSRVHVRIEGDGRPPRVVFKSPSVARV